MSACCELSATKTMAHIGLQILWLTNIVTLTTASSSIQYRYPSASLACKTYNKTELDCSNRNLVEIPTLDQNLTTSLDLSVNNLPEITGAPFEQLQVLLLLDLRSNGISQLSVIAFRGLYSLRVLFLNNNKLTDLPADIFADLSNLIIINLDLNEFKAMPNQALSSLKSLQTLHYFSHYDHFKINLNGLQNLSHLTTMTLYVEDLQTDITSDTFQQLSHSPLQDLTFLWPWKWDNYTIDGKIFKPLAKLTRLTTCITALPVLESIHSPLYHLELLKFTFDLPVVNTTTLQVLQKWNTSLTHLTLFFLILQQIDDYSFIWTPNLTTLDLAQNEIHYLAKHAFYGLGSLKRLLLNENYLSEVPSEALQVFKKSATLQYLDLSINMFSNIPDEAFSALSSSLTYLKAEVHQTSYANVKWISVLQKLNRISLKCSEYKSIYVGLNTPLLSLEHLRINGGFRLRFRLPLCSSFPNLEEAIISNAEIANFPSALALHKCSHLIHLDLSGSIDNIDSLDLDNPNISIPTLNKLIMAKNQVTSINQIIFLKAPMLTTLDLSHNLITSIDPGIAMAYPNLENLLIDDNGLESLAGLQGLPFLQKLSASQNQITSIPTWLISRPSSSLLMRLKLSNNPYQCTCKIEPFRKWILSDTNTWLQPGQYACATPETLKGVSITGIELDCRSNTPLYLGVGFAVGILICILLITLFKYQWHIKYKLFLLYRNYRTIPDNIEEEFIELDLQYHAYVAYNDESAEDSAWVMNDLQPNMEEGPEPLRLFIKDRDFRPGNLIEMIDENMDRSRKTILVLSPNFVESEWCYHEMRMAHMRLLDHNLDVLVLVLLHTIPENKRTLSLRQLLCKKKYLKWPKDKAGQRLFWRRLRHEIKGPLHVDRCFQL